MKIEHLKPAGLILITPSVFGDHRGWFTESWNAAKLASEGVDVDFVQDNHSFSANKGTLRGLHFQAPPNAQDKLVRCTRGAIWDVAVDFRQGSNTYLQWIGHELSAENHQQFLIPKGFLHGFVTLSDNCEVQYKCSASYAPVSDRSIRWNDPQIGIRWPINDTPHLSEKDAEALFVSQIFCPFQG